MSQQQLLTRDQFRERVFARDQHKCVICSQPGVDAHHIIERRLWTEPHQRGGYFIDNGATLCSRDHLLAEQTILSVQQIREAAGCDVVLPDHMYRDVQYDKWGNIITSKTTRTPGELFYDESVQKILDAGGVLSMFTQYVKYPRTYHLPWSNPGKDDRSLADCSQFEGKRVIVTEKMDGENTNLYRDHVHARSLEKASGDDRAAIWKLWNRIGWEIPDKWRLCGENLQCTHSIRYSELPSYFMLFSIWDDRNCCLAWDDTVTYAQMLGISTVPVLYDGVFDREKIMSLYVDNRQPDPMEGYVVRNAEQFPYSAFRHNVAKFVRPNHVTSATHWRYSRKSYNQVANNDHAQL